MSSTVTGSQALNDYQDLELLTDSLFRMNGSREGPFVTETPDLLTSFTDFTVIMSEIVFSLMKGFYQVLELTEILGLELMNFSYNH